MTEFTSTPPTFTNDDDGATLTIHHLGSVRAGHVLVEAREAGRDATIPIPAGELVRMALDAAGITREAVRASMGPDRARVGGHLSETRDAAADAVWDFLTNGAKP
ncbi:hypothetical protein [Arsenicicoccus dermatophilus]|uniref:hypothetical protein n=1 Tax=Arsenicicoccus dermatophilus TaxID=1076331 RepID=UPI003916F9C3